MKQLFTTFALLIIFLLNSQAQTNGVLTVTTTTSGTGGTFEPKNIVAIWVEDNSGNFVKTMLAYAQNQMTYLNTWEASTTNAEIPFNVVDAITGATQLSHGTRTCTWNGTDVVGFTVPDGTYNVWMELTDKNATGNFSSFTFTKGAIEDNQTPSDVPSFSLISINWVPSGSSEVLTLDPKQYNVFPNPSTGYLEVSGEDVISVDISNIFGDVLETSDLKIINTEKLAKGVYFVNIHTDKGIVLKKLVKE